MAVAIWTPFINQAEYRAQDATVAWTSTRTDPSLVLVALDEISIGFDAAKPVEPGEIAQSRALQLMQQGFPWSREVFALAARRLLDAGARLVIFDLVFPSSRDGDTIFADAIRSANGRIILGSNFPSDSASSPGSSFVYAPPAPLLAQAAGDSIGAVVFPPSPDGIIRWMYPYLTTAVLSTGEYGDDPVVPALSTCAALKLGFAPPLSPQVRLLRFPFLRPGSIPRFSFYQLFVPGLWERNFKDGAIFRDKVVMIGPTAEILHDVQLTPVGRMPGPELHLNVLSAMREGRWLHSSSPWLVLLSIPLVGLVIFFLIAGQRTVHRLTGIGILLGILWIIIYILVFLSSGLFLPLAHPLTALLICGLAALTTDISIERRERGRLRSTLERYVSKDVVREIVDNPASYLQQLGGQRKQIVALFSDLKGFTADSETIDPSDMVRLLNEYFTDMVDVLFAHKGTLDKFLGDALMATWGGVVEIPPAEAAREAVLASLEMKAALASLNESRLARGIASWQAGTGICQGPAIFGNIGSQQKMDPTVIGDTVNLASRVESLTRIYRCDILIDERVASHAGGICSLLLVDIVRVKGRRAHETIFHPYRGNDSSLRWSEAFTAARLLYIDQHFAEARDAFDVLSRSGLVPGLAACYRDRCALLLRNPPAPDWDGIWEFLEK